MAAPSTPRSASSSAKPYDKANAKYAAARARTIIDSSDEEGGDTLPTSGQGQSKPTQENANDQAKVAARPALTTAKADTAMAGGEKQVEAVADAEMNDATTDNGTSGLPPAAGAKKKGAQSAEQEDTRAHALGDKATHRADGSAAEKAANRDADAGVATCVNPTPARQEQPLASRDQPNRQESHGNPHSNPKGASASRHAPTQHRADVDGPDMRRDDVQEEGNRRRSSDAGRGWREDRLPDGRAQGNGYPRSEEYGHRAEHTYRGHEQREQPHHGFYGYDRSLLRSGDGSEHPRNSHRMREEPESSYYPEQHSLRGDRYFDAGLAQCDSREGGFAMRDAREMDAMDVETSHGLAHEYGYGGEPYQSENVPRDCSDGRVAPPRRAFASEGMPRFDVEGDQSRIRDGETIEEFTDQSATIATGAVADGQRDSGPRFTHRLRWFLSPRVIWPFREYPDPMRPDSVGRGTRRFRYEGNHRNLTPKDLSSMLVEVKIQLHNQYPYIPVEELVVMAPTAINNALYVDVLARTARAYTEIEDARLTALYKPFHLAFSGAPYPHNQIMFRVNSIDVRNRLVPVLNSMRRELGPSVRIIAFWAMYRRDTIVDDIATPSDFTGMVYALAEATGDRLDLNRLPGFLDFADLEYPRRLPVFFPGRPDDCKMCSARAPKHLATECPINRRPGKGGRGAPRGPPRGASQRRG